MNFSTEREIRELVRKELSGISPIQPNNSGQNETEAEITSLSARIDELKTAIDAIKKDEGLVNQDLNYTTRGTYEGNEVRFSLFGQVLTPEEKDQFGNINFIEFGGGEGGGNFAFRLIPTFTTDEPPQPRIRVSYGETNKEAPNNIDDLFAPANNGLIWLMVAFESDGTFESSSIQVGATLPANTPTSLHVLIGKVTLQNDAYTIDRQALLGDIIVRRYNICENGEPVVEFIFSANNESIPIF
jgi:hypothetical protein